MHRSMRLWSRSSRFVACIIYLAFVFPVYEVGRGISGKPVFSAAAGPVHVIFVALNVQHIWVAKLYRQGILVGAPGSGLSK